MGARALCAAIAVASVLGWIRSLARYDDIAVNPTRAVGGFITSAAAYVEIVVGVNTDVGPETPKGIFFNSRDIHIYGNLESSRPRFGISAEVDRGLSGKGTLLFVEIDYWFILLLAIAALAADLAYDRRRRTCCPSGFPVAGAEKTALGGQK